MSDVPFSSTTCLAEAKMLSEQWRLQYKRVMEKAGTVEGVLSVYKTKPLT